MLEGSHTRTKWDLPWKAESKDGSTNELPVDVTRAFTGQGDHKMLPAAATGTDQAENAFKLKTLSKPGQWHHVCLFLTLPSK